MAPSGRLLIPAVLFGLQALALVTCQSATGDHGLGLLNNILENDKDSFCQYVTCMDPITPEDCQPPNIFLPGVSQYGCCGACVQHRDVSEHCTGSIDPRYCGGYGLYDASDQSCRDPFTKLRQTRFSLADNLYTQDNILKSSFCGYNIACGNDGTCAVDPTSRGCSYVQKKYDEAIESGDYVSYRDDYRWRPTCSADGFFAEKQCKGPLEEQRCVCVDPDGNRLFGDAYPYQGEQFTNMNCKCSRRVWELQQEGQKSVTLHCQPNGNYEPLQCEDQWCYCIDPVTATPYGSRLPEGSIQLLECYNKTHVGEQYLRKCESEYHAFHELYEVLGKKGVTGPTTRLSCDADGSFSALQCNADGCQCYDKCNQLISAPGGDGCQCKRDVKFNAENNIDIDITCEVNSGKYEAIQIRGEFAFCVDQDGVRAGPLVYQSAKDNLGCKYAAMCQDGSKYSNCEEACSNCGIEVYPKAEDSK